MLTNPPGIICPLVSIKRRSWRSITRVDGHSNAMPANTFSTFCLSLLRHLPHGQHVPPRKTPPLQDRHLSLSASFLPFTFSLTGIHIALMLRTLTGGKRPQGPSWSSPTSVPGSRCRLECGAAPAKSSAQITFTRSLCAPSDVVTG